MSNAVETSKTTGNGPGFGEELAMVWRAMPDKGLFLGLLGAWLALFHFLGNSTFGYLDSPSLFGWLKFVYTTTPDDEHGMLVPLVVLALFWWKRQGLLAVPKQNWWPALALVGFALLLHMGGYLVQQTRISVIAFFIGIFGLTGLVWGRAWLRESFFPYFLFAFCLPLATVSEVVTFPLRLIVTRIVVVISQILGVDVIRDGTQIFNAAHTFAFEVAPACSGIRSLLAMAAVTTIYAFMSFATGWKRLVVMLAAIPLAVLGNVTRLTLVVVTAAAFGQDAGAWVEQKLGIVTFIAALGGMFLLGMLLREPKTAPPPAEPKAA